MRSDGSAPGSQQIAAEVCCVPDRYARPADALAVARVSEQLQQLDLSSRCVMQNRISTNSNPIGDFASVVLRDSTSC
jgi:hypothetical protein